MTKAWAPFLVLKTTRIAHARIGALAFLVAAVVGLLSGCGGGDQPARPQLDVTWLQRDLTATLKRQTGIAAVEHMACPQVQPRPGLTLECSAAFNAEPDPIVVTLLDARPRPRYRARLKNLLLGALEGALQRRLERAGFPVASVDCPGPVPQRRGGMSTCTVEDPQGREAEVRVVQIDDRGRVRFEPLRRRPSRR